MKWKRALLCGFLLFLLAGATVLPASAEESEEALWGDFRDSLPPIVADELPDSPDPTELGELVGAKHLLSLLMESLAEGTSVTLPYLASMLGLVLLTAAAELLLPDGAPSSVKSLSSVAVAVCFALSLSSVAGAGIERVTVYLSDLSALMTGILPTLAGVMAASGGAASAAATAAGATAVLAVVGSLASGLLPGVASASFAFSLIGSLGGEVKTDGIPKCLRSLYLSLTGILGTVATGALALRSSLAAAADSMALRTAKYAVGSMIPIVGGSISSSLGTVTASLTLLRKAVGVGGVAAILFLCLPTLAELLLTRFSFSIAGAVAHLFRSERAEKMLSEFRAVWDMMLAVAAFSTVMLLLSVAVFIKTGVTI